MPGKKRVLIVDDEAGVLSLLNLILTKNRFEVLEASSADSALEMLEHETVDLVISDITMPGMSGIEFLEEVREWDMDLPVIFVSGQDSSKARAKGIAGASALIAKPFKKDTLLKTVHKVLSSNSPPAEMSLETEETEKLDY